MVAINKILLPECTGEGRGGGTRNAPREARLHACSPFYFLLSPVCRRSPPTRDPIGYQGGINLYGYVNSSPVGSVDAEGTKWTITRDGKARATVSGQTGDTVVSLLATKDNHGNLILLDASQYKKWLRPVGGSKLPATDTSPLKCDEKFTIPNTAWIFDNISATSNWGRAFAQGALLGLTLDGVGDAWAVKWRGDGLDVHNTGPGYQGNSVGLMGAFKSPDTYAIGILSHTDDTDRGALVFNSEFGNLLLPGVHSTSGLGELKIYACRSASPYRAAGSTDSVVDVWSGNVSKAGWYAGWAGYLGIYQYFNNAGLVRIHGSQ